VILTDWTYSAFVLTRKQRLRSGSRYYIDRRPSIAVRDRAWAQDMQAILFIYADFVAELDGIAAAPSVEARKALTSMPQEQLTDFKKSLALTYSPALNKTLAKYIQLDENVNYNDMVVDVLIALTRSSENKINPFVADVAKKLSAMVPSQRT